MDRYCLHCAKPLPASATGRPRRWCSGACKAAAGRQRRALRTSAEFSEQPAEVRDLMLAARELAVALTAAAERVPEPGSVRVLALAAAIERGLGQ